MANRQIFQHEEDILLNDECKLLEDDANNKTKMFKLETLKNFIAEFVKDKIKSWEYDSLKTKGKNIIESANEIYDTTQKRMVSLEEIDLVTVEGFFVDALAVKELNRKLIYGETVLAFSNGIAIFDFDREFSVPPKAVFLISKGTDAGSGQIFKISSISTTSCRVCMWDTTILKPSGNFTVYYLVLG